MSAISNDVSLPLRRTTSKKAVLPTNLTTKKYPIHRWFNFVAGFSPEFVDSCIEQLPARVTNTLLDPFTGCGTAQVEGLRNKMNVVGYEAHPFFFKIAKAKLSMNSLRELDEIRSAIAVGFLAPVSIDTVSESARNYLCKLYRHEDLEKLLGARRQLESVGVSDLAYLVLSKIFDQVSHSKTDGIYKAPTSVKNSKSPEAALDLVFALLQEDLSKSDKNTYLDRRLFNQTSERMEKVGSDTIDLIVTSPPYLNNFDFAEMTRQYLYFWGEASSWSDISDLVRASQIVNTTTALKGHRDIQNTYRDSLPLGIQTELEPIVSELNSQKRLRAGKKDYDLLVFPYFSQMQSVLVECFRVLRVGGHFHMMVSDAALYGTHIPAPQVLSRIMSEIGFYNVECNKVRERGNRWVLKKRDGSPVGLGEYHIIAGKTL